MSKRRRSRGKRATRNSRWQHEDDDLDDVESNEVEALAAHRDAALGASPASDRGDDGKHGVVATSLAEAVRVAVDAQSAVVEPVAESSQVMTRPIELVPTAGELAVMTLARAVPDDVPEPIESPRTAPPAPPPGAPVLVIRIPPKVTSSPETKPEPEPETNPEPKPAAKPALARQRTRSRRSVVVASAMAFAGILVAIGSVIWARGEVERARRESATRAVAVVAASEPSGPIALNTAPRPVEPSAIAPSGARIDPQAASSRLDPIQAAPPAPVLLHERTASTARHVAEAGSPRPASASTTAAPRSAIEQRAAARTSQRRAQTEVTVDSSPQGATVTIDGRAIGKTPLVTKVDRGREITLRFHAPGVASDWRRIRPTRASSAVHATLQPR